MDLSRLKNRASCCITPGGLAQNIRVESTSSTLSPASAFSGVAGGESVAAGVAFEPGVLFEVESELRVFDWWHAIDRDQAPLFC